MDFVTIDFETATADRDSPCEIGLTFIKENVIVETKSWLIKPRYKQFNHFNVSIHGITSSDVAQSPDFGELWIELKPLLENQFLIAHNASFDISVLRKTLESYKIPYPTFQYSCSYIFSKKVWEGLPGYDLKSLCRINDIDLTHHRAGPDSRATAQLALKAFDLVGLNELSEFPEKLKTTIGDLYTGSYRSSETTRKHNSKNISEFVGDPSNHNPDSIFYQRKVVFTGALSSMTRDQAHQLITDIGGFISSSVSSNTDYLIVGQQDYRIVGEDGMSSKQEKAINLTRKGAPLEILSEREFLKHF